MKRRTASIHIAIAMSFLIVAGFGTIADAQTTVSRADVDQLIANWPAKSREVAATVMEKYGQPHEATASMLIWHGNGPWKRTILHRDPVPHDFPKPHVDLLEQVIDYRVPPEKFDDLAIYDGSVIAERTKGELAARCDKEGANFLALNLAHDIVTGRRTITEARQFYADTVAAMMAGEKPPYVRGLQFQPMARAADPGISVMPQPMTSAAAGQETRTGTVSRTRFRKQ